MELIPILSMRSYIYREILIQQNPLILNLEKSLPVVPSLYYSINATGSVTNIEQYHEKYDKVAWNLLKTLIVKKIKNEPNLQNEYIIASYKNERDSLKSEFYILRDETKQKSDIPKKCAEYDTL